MHAFQRPRRHVSTALVGLVAAIGLLVAAPSLAVGKYTDPAGDSAGGPDVTNVEVAHDSNGQILFRISVSGLQRGADMATFLALDTDVNPATGHPSWVGSEYLFVLDELTNSYLFGRWNGSGWSWDAPDATVQVRDAPGVLLVSVNASELGGAQSFNFSVAAAGVAQGQWDDAPEEGHFNYSLAAGGPDIRSVRVEARPAAGPRAGGVFTVAAVALELPPNGGLLAPTPAPESYTCVARLGARQLNGTGTGRCTFKIPKKNAKKKTLRIVVTASYQGASKPLTLTYKVR